MSKGTLIMMHGMTGTSEKMEELARGLTPEGWSTLCPQAKIRHPTRGGFAWWLFEEGVSEEGSRFPKWKTHYQESWRLYQKVR